MEPDWDKTIINVDVLRNCNKQGKEPISLVLYHIPYTPESINAILIILFSEISPTVDISLIVVVEVATDVFSLLVVGFSLVVVGFSLVVVGFSLVVVGFSLLVKVFSLLVVGFSLLVVGFSLVVVGVSLLVMVFSLLVVGFSLLVVGFSLLVVGFSPLVVGLPVRVGDVSCGVEGT